MHRLTHLALQYLSGVEVAAAAAAESGRPWAFDLHADGGCGSNGPADRPPAAGFTRVWVCGPGGPGGCHVGLAKRLYTMRCQGETVPAEALAVFTPGRSPARPRPVGPPPPARPPDTDRPDIPAPARVPDPDPAVVAAYARGEVPPPARQATLFD